MDSDYELGRQNLEKLIEWYKPRIGERNEATTRLQLIDSLLFECLGWSKQDALLEEPYGQEYTDYTLSAPRRILIIEAKKEGDYIELPSGKERVEYSIPSLTRDYSNLKAAIEQAARYCQTRGVPFGAVTNGHQVIAFVANRNDGLPPLEGRALVFPSLEFMLDNFLQFWEALSKPGIEQKKLQARLIGDVVPNLPRKLSATVTSYPGVKLRNVLQTDLQALSELVFEDLIQSSDLREEFLEQCYSPSGALSQYALVSKNILQTRYAALFSSETGGPAVTPAVDKQGISEELLAESFSRRPILLIGDVGVGKTTFIRRLIHVEAAPLFKNAITIYINLGSQATLSSDLQFFVLDELSRQLRDDHDVDVEERDFVYSVYHSELLRFSKGIYSGIRESNPDLYKLKEIEFLEEKLKNREQHLKAVLQNIANRRRKQVVLFIDNADQRDDATQQQAFLISQEIAERWRPVTVFVALRPETFYRSQKMGALSGYHPKAFTISPPRIDRVIEKRLEFALKLTSGQIPISSLEGVRIDLQKLSELINIFLTSLAYNADLGACIDNIVGGNVRLALDIVKSFFGSGHVDTQKILQTYEEYRSYTIPLHEFLRALIYGDAEYYAPDQSPVANVFDIFRPDPREHFLLPIVLGILVSASKSGVEEGFIETSVLYERLQGLGFIPDQIDMAVTVAHRKKLLEAASRRIPQPGLDMPQALRITTVGVYHIERLCCEFPYVDAIVIDTPILDSQSRELIHNVSGIADRLNRADLFRQYLDKQWALLRDTGAASAFDWQEVSSLLKTSVERIRRRVI